MSNEIVGKKVTILLRGRPTMAPVTIVEQVGNGFLGKNEYGIWYSIHYDVAGKLSASQTFDSEDEARKRAEETQDRKD